MTIQRWQFDGDPDEAGMLTDPAGAWVTYDDHLAEIAKWEAAVKAQEKRIAQIKAAIKDYESPLA